MSKINLKTSNSKLVFSQNNFPKWGMTHAQVPTPIVLKNKNIIRVFFASRPEEGKTQIGFADFDYEMPNKLLHVSSKPVLDVGEPGTFDEHGVMPSCILEVNNKLFLYYSGWSRSVVVPYTNSSGLAISEDGGNTFHRVSKGPIISKSIYDPYSATCPFVLKNKNNWLMFYCSGTNWLKINKNWEHEYDIKIASSNNGINWNSQGNTIIKSDENMNAITRPWLLDYKGSYYLFYCYRKSYDFRDGSGSYKIGISFSNNLEDWEFSKSLHLQNEKSDWDKLAQCYPAIIKKENEILFYQNGNTFGTNGFGLKTLFIGS